MKAMKRILGLAAAVLLVACLAAAGCTGTAPAENETATPTATESPAANVTGNATPAETVAPVESYSYTEADNNQTVTLPAGSDITISLEENPTTGFQWNATASAGLVISNDSFVAPVSNLTGAPGVHVWSIQANETGNQTFDAVYTRSWENVTGNETSFGMAFIVE